MPMKRESFSSGVLKSLFKDNKDFLRQIEEARTNLITYIDRKKLLNLFVECIDECPFVEFNDKRDRRINKSNPVFKVKILYEKIPSEVLQTARAKASIADAKTNIIRIGVISNFMIKLHQILKDPNSEYLIDKLPDQEVRDTIKDFIMTFFMLDASDDAMKPVYIRHLM
jgi:hypothetical protein